MGYPEPIPTLSVEETEEFEKRLAEFTLTDEQLEFFREAASLYGPSE